MSDLLLLLMLAATPDMSRSEWFKSLMIPGTRQSCCDEADCKPTRAENRDGQWYAEMAGAMVAVPENRIVRDQITYDGRAYVCTYGGRVLCFVPPGAGY